MNAGESVPAAAPRKSKTKKVVLIVLAITAAGVLAEQAWYHYTYPYGWSHACSKGLGMSLRQYAQDHEHWFPHGEATPEASLSLLYGYDTNDALWVLGGKYISRKTIEETFNRDGKLSPETCGWHYIEGLRDDDAPEIVIAWDKVVGLGHNGQRWPDQMHEVVYLDGSTGFITKKGWSQFVIDEKKRLDDLISSRKSNAPPIRWSDEKTLGPNRPIQKQNGGTQQTAADIRLPPS